MRLKEYIYHIIEFVTDGRGLEKRINGFRIKLPARYVNYFPADYEYINFAFLKQQVKKGDTVMDIGAHIGMFSVIAAQLTGNIGKVYAMEPATETFKLLQKTISINKVSAVVEPFQYAMGTECGKTTFYVSDIIGDNSNSLVSYKNDRELQSTEVIMFSIDAFVKREALQSLAFIKIDVEGAEFDTLLGAEKTLHELRPTCIVAIHPEPIAAKGDSLEKLYDYLVAMNYSILVSGNVISKEAFCNNKALIDLHLLPK